MVKRIFSGVKGFDELVGGGIPSGSVTLVAGTPGTGKSIFCAQVAYYNASKGKKCLYLDLEQKNDQLKDQLKDFGFSQKKAFNNLKIVSVENSEKKLLEKISKEISQQKYDVIVIDSLESIITSSSTIGEGNGLNLEQVQETVFPTVVDSKSVGRLRLRKLFSQLTTSKASVFLVGEKVEGKQGLSRDTVSEFLCDNIITMNYLGVGAVDFRSLQIRKLRRSNHEKGFVLFKITNKGIMIVEDPLNKKK